DRVRPQRRVPVHRPREPPGQVAGEVFEAVAADEVEAGGIGHAGMMPERGRTSRYEEVRTAPDARTIAGVAEAARPLCPVSARRFGREPSQPALRSREREKRSRLPPLLRVGWFACRFGR